MFHILIIPETILVYVFMACFNQILDHLQCLLTIETLFINRVMTFCDRYLFNVGSVINIEYRSIKSMLIKGCQPIKTKNKHRKRCSTLATDDVSTCQNSDAGFERAHAHPSRKRSTSNGTIKLIKRYISPARAPLALIREIMCRTVCNLQQ